MQTDDRKLTPIFHITPKGDTYEHIVDASGSCWCCPTKDFDGEYTHFHHHAYDRREDYEDGLRQPN